MAKVFTFAGHTGMASAKHVLGQSSKIVKKVKSAQQAKLAKIDHGLHTQFATLEARYHDFKPRVKAFGKAVHHKADEVKHELETKAAQYERVTGKSVKETLNFMMAANSVRQDFNQAVDQWFNGKKR